MTIVPSRSADIQKWLAALGAEPPRARDSAIARLTLVGERAVPGLLEALRSGGGLARVGALRVLERLRIPRVLPELEALLGADDPEIAAAAATAVAAYETPDALPGLVRSLHHPAAAAREAATRGLLQLFAAGVEEAMEPLLAAAFDPGLEEPLQALALSVVDLLPESERRAILAQAREAAGRSLRKATGEIDALLASLPDGASAVTALHRALVSLAGARTPAAAGAGARLHLALAERDSRIALYDLRERLQERPPLESPSLLKAAAGVGDSSLVASIVALAADAPAHTAAAADALAAIVAREALKKTHRDVKAVRPEHRKVLDGLWARATRGR
jgi:hypothetical protein